MNTTATHPSHYNHVVEDGWLYRNNTLMGAVALCGFTWVPTGFDPRKPTCPACQHITTHPT